MQTIKDIAIPIRTWDYSETSQTVSLFTRAHGVLRGLAKGAKREKGAFSGGIEVLTRGEIVALVKPGRDLATLTAWDLQELFPAIRKRIDANQTALYMVDLVNHMMTAGDPHPEAFDQLLVSVRALEDHVRVPGALLAFQWTLLREAGYQPELNRDAVTDQPLPDDDTWAFSPTAGGVAADTGTGDRWRVRRTTIQLLRTLRDDPTGTDDATSMDLDRANRLLAAYLREILGEALPTMQLLFGPDIAAPTRPR